MTFGKRGESCRDVGDRGGNVPRMRKKKKQKTRGGRTAFTTKVFSCVAKLVDREVHPRHGRLDEQHVFISGFIYMWKQPYYRTENVVYNSSLYGHIVQTMYSRTALLYVHRAFDTVWNDAVMFEEESKTALLKLHTFRCVAFCLTIKRCHCCICIVRKLYDATRSLFMYHASVYCQ